jgi:hypothetical protein
MIFVTRLIDALCNFTRKKLTNMETSRILEAPVTKINRARSVERQGKVTRQSTVYTFCCSPRRLDQNLSTSCPSLTNTNHVLLPNQPEWQPAQQVATNTQQLRHTCSPSSDLNTKLQRDYIGSLRTTRSLSRPSVWQSVKYMETFAKHRAVNERYSIWC